MFCLKVTVMHSMQAGYLEKAQKYTDKALMQLEKLKSKFVLILAIYFLLSDIDVESTLSCLFLFKVLDNSPILSTFQVILLEHIIMCRLVTGHKATALQEVSHQLFVVRQERIMSKSTHSVAQVYSGTSCFLVIIPIFV